MGPRPVASYGCIEQSARDEEIEMAEFTATSEYDVGDKVTVAVGNFLMVSGYKTVTVTNVRWNDERKVFEYALSSSPGQWFTKDYIVAKADA